MPYITTSENGIVVSKIELIIPIETYRQSKIYEFRGMATYAIQSAGLNEATQQNAAMGIYPPKRCEAIKSYISACRNEYLRCKALIMAAQTNDEADAVRFLAPPVPEGI